MPAYDWQNGPVPDIHPCRAVDAMGQDLGEDIVFIHTEVGLVVRLLRDADGNFEVDREAQRIRTKSETRPAPIQILAR